MFNVGNYVTRKSYNNDIVFKIVRIEDDLEICKDYKEKNKFEPSLNECRSLNRTDFFYLPGKILYIDVVCIK